MEGNSQETAICQVEHTETMGKQEWYETVSFQDAKAIIRANLATAARSFIAIGYYLKHIRNQELYRDGGFDSIWEFAQTEYGISKSTASRYMKMNDHFSQGGNSPVIQEKYKQFNKSQLQEMLSLDHDQLDQVTPTDRVEDIRAMRKPKEIPYVELPGQISIADFPGIAPEELTAADGGLSRQEEEETAALPQPYTLTVAQMIGEDDGEAEVEGVARSQQEGRCENGSGCLENAAEPAVESLSAYGTPKRIYPPDSLIATEGCEGGHDCFSCAMNCQIRGEERYCREAPMGNPFPCEITRGGFSDLPDTCQFIDHARAAHCVGNGEPDPCCKNCLEPCEYICGRAMKALDQETEIPEAGQEDAAISQQEEMSDMELLRSMLEKEKSTLEEMLKVNKVEPHPALEKILRKKKLLVGALAGTLCGLEQPELPETEDIPEQPELPAMKNNDQRKEWLNTFHDWPIWFEVPQAAEVYYRYDLPDGCSLVICEYHYWSSWRVEFKYGGAPECTGTREYLLTPGYHYLEDCKSNRTTMIEKLKEIQKR